MANTKLDGEKTKRERLEGENEIPFFLEQNLLTDQENGQSSLSQLSYKYSPAPHIIHTSEEKFNSIITDRQETLKEK